MEAALHKYEAARLSDLDSYGILDTDPELSFDRLTRIAAHVMAVPVALVTFVARERQFVKSCLGLSLWETSRDVAFCAHTILSEQLLVVLDALEDPRFADNPLVTGPPYIRYYVGAPLVAPSGLPLGALCAIDYVPHESPSEEQLSILRDLAAETVEQLEFRNARRDLDECLEDLAAVQRTMLRVAPSSCNLQVDLRFFPKHMAGGDFLCHYRVDQDNELVLLTDVSGHDLKAAYLAAHSQGMVRAMIKRGVPIDGIFEELNNHFVEQSEHCDSVGTSLAACAVACNARTSELIVWNYGSPTPIYIDLAGFPHLLDDARGCTLGWFSALEDAATHRVVNGGSLVAWTDGLEDLAFEMGITPLNMALRLHRENPDASRPDWLLRARDDVMSTFIKVRTGSIEAADQEWLPFLLQHWEAEAISDIDAMQHSWGRDLKFAVPGLSDSTLFDILLCAREATLNGMQHGCEDGGKVTICMRLDPQRQLIRVTVCDEGSGHSFDPSTRESPELPSGHRGLLLIQQLANRCIRERNGASLTMEFAYETSDGQ